MCTKRPWHVKHDLALSLHVNKTTFVDTENFTFETSIKVFEAAVNELVGESKKEAPSKLATASIT